MARVPANAWWGNVRPSNRYQYPLQSLPWNIETMSVYTIFLIQSSTPLFSSLHISQWNHRRCFKIEMFSLHVIVASSLYWNILGIWFRIYSVWTPWRHSQWPMKSLEIWWHSECYVNYCHNLTGPWWRHQMETFSALLDLCAENSPVPGEFPSQRPVTRSFDVFFDLRRNKRLSKQSWCWWFETPSCSLWRHRNENVIFC